MASAAEEIRRQLAESARIKQSFSDELVGRIAQFVEKSAAALRSGGKLVFFGNGGSAADAQHLAAELVGRFRRERAGFRAIALTTDTSILTAVANDYGYGSVFERQVDALVGPGDLAIGLSTSGGSENVVRGLAAARRKGAATVALGGSRGGRMVDHADVSILVPSSDTARIQEAHIAIIHALCEIVDAGPTEP